MLEAASRTPSERHPSGHKDRKSQEEVKARGAKVVLGAPDGRCSDGRITVFGRTKTSSVLGRDARAVKLTVVRVRNPFMGGPPKTDVERPCQVMQRGACELVFGAFEQEGLGFLQN